MIPKFRAWKKAGKELGRVLQITFELDGSVSHVLFKGEFLDFNVSINEIILMQSTGLFDKNDQEIFEGDVLKSNKYITSVFYERGAYCVKFCRTPNTTVTMDVISFIKKYKTRIVGNIYENPELLEVIDAKRK